MPGSGPDRVDPEWAFKVAAILFTIGALIIFVMVGLL